MSYFSNYGNFCVHKVSKIVNLLSLDRFFQPHNTPKFVFFLAGAPARTPLGELTTLPQTPQSAAEGDTPSPLPSPLDVFGISILGAFGASLLDAFSISIRAKPASAPPLAFLF